MVTTKVRLEGTMMNEDSMTTRIQPQKHCRSNASSASVAPSLLLLLLAVGGADAFGLCSVPRGRAVTSSTSLPSTLSADLIWTADDIWASGFGGALLPMRLPAFLSPGRGASSQQDQHRPAALPDLVADDVIVQAEEELETNDTKFEHTFFLEYDEAFTDEYLDCW